MATDTQFEAQENAVKQAAQQDDETEDTVKRVAQDDEERAEWHSALKKLTMDQDARSQYEQDKAVTALKFAHSKVKARRELIEHIHADLVESRSGLTSEEYDQLAEQVVSADEELQSQYIADQKRRARDEDEKRERAR